MRMRRCWDYSYAYLANGVIGILRTGCSNYKLGLSRLKAADGDYDEWVEFLEQGRRLMLSKIKIFV